MIVGISLPSPTTKPRSRFCWVCSRKLRGRSFVYLLMDDSTDRVCHKQCAKDEYLAESGKELGNNCQIKQEVTDASDAEY